MRIHTFREEASAVRDRLFKMHTHHSSQRIT